MVEPLHDVSARLLPLIDVLYTAVADPSQFGTVPSAIATALGADGVWIRTRAARRRVRPSVARSTSRRTRRLVGLVNEQPDRRLDLVALRSDEHEPFSDEDRRLFAAALPHVGRALQMQALALRAQAMTAAPLRAIDLLAVAVLVVDGTGRIVLSNHEAERTLAVSSSLRRAGRRLVASDRASGAKLAGAIGRAARAGAASHVRMLRLSSSGGESLQVAVSGIEAREADAAQGAVLLLLRRPDEPWLNELAVQELFGLTAVEARVAAALAAGWSESRMAQELELAVSTLRGVVDRVCVKTDARTVAQAAVVLTRSLAGVLRPGAIAGGAARAAGVQDEERPAPRRVLRVTTLRAAGRSGC